MLEVPLTPYFFDKLAIYQRVKKGEKSTTGKETWPMEKALLVWTVGGHHHLYSTINADFCEDRLKDACFKDEDLRNVRKVMGNLVQRELATKESEHKKTGEIDSIRLTPKGLAWGEVLYELEEGGWWGKHKYQAVVYSIWILLGLFATSFSIEKFIFIIEKADIFAGSLIGILKNWK